MNRNRLSLLLLEIDTFDGAKPRFLNRGKKRRSVSTLSIPRASDPGVEWVDYLYVWFLSMSKELSTHRNTVFCNKF